MAVRSNYIKNLIETRKTLDQQYQEVITESMKNIIGDNAKDEVRRLLKEAEDEDTYSEEEVNTDETDIDKDGVTDDASDGDSSTDDDITAGEDGDQTLDIDGDTEDGSETDDDVWDDLENCKMEDGEYDCRGMENGNLLKVLKSMGPEEGLRVMSNGNGTVTIEVDGDMIDGEQEFVLELDDVDPIEESVNEANLGYTTKYQKNTAMTTPDNHEPADSSKTYSMDGGVPTGTERPYGNPKKKAKPFEKTVNEGDNDECLVEVEIEEPVVNEVMTTTENNPTVRNTPMTHANTNQKGKKFRNSSEGGVKVKGTTQNTYESVEFKRQMNQLFEENKQMKSIIPELNNKLMEAMIINANMGYVVRLINENATNSDEKKNISERFAKVTTLEEGKKLYETISAELKSTNRSSDVNGIINGQLAEGKQNGQMLVETTMYKSKNETLDFMRRLDAIK